MSEFKITVVRVGKIDKHPNADTLGITKIFDYPVICKLGEFHEGELAVYLPVDSVVPGDQPRWAFLDGHTRIKAKKLRGIFSMGLLTRADPAWQLGEDVCDQLGIKKYEPPVQYKMGDNEPCPFAFPCYTDIEGLRRHPDIFVPGEPVVMLEKVHGANLRFVWHDDRLWVGSHSSVKRQEPDSLFWKAAALHDVGGHLQQAPDMVLYGEVYGRVQDLRYGIPNGIQLAFFDALDLKAGRYLNHADFLAFVSRIGFSDLVVPEIYRGPWLGEKAYELAEGPSRVSGADNVREGVVIKPLQERFDERIGRVILKVHGQGYLLRKQG